MFKSLDEKYFAQVTRARRMSDWRHNQGIAIDLSTGCILLLFVLPHRRWIQAPLACPVHKLRCPVSQASNAINLKKLLILDNLVIQWLGPARFRASNFQEKAARISNGTWLRFLIRYQSPEQRVSIFRVSRSPHLLTAWIYPSLVITGSRYNWQWHVNKPPSLELLIQVHSCLGRTWNLKAYRAVSK